MIRWSQPVLLNDIVFGEQLEKTLGRMVVSGLARMGVILRVLCGETRRTHLCTMNVPAALTKKKTEHQCVSNGTILGMSD